MASPTIPTSGVGFGDLTSTVSASIGGTLANDIVLMLAGCDNGLDVTGVAGTAMGTPWTKLLDVTSGGSGVDNGACSLWWATVPASTVSVSATATFAGTAHLTAAILFNVRGCNPGAPFDPNVSLPKGQGGNPPGTIVFSTTQADDLLISFRAGHAASPFAGMPAGWTKLAFVANSGLLQFMTEVVGYQSVSSVQTNVSYNDDPNCNSFSCIGIVALTADAPVSLPAVPISESCGANTTTSITPTWADGGGSTPTSYTLQWRPPGGGSFTTISGITGTSQQISGLMPSTSYEWQVQSTNSNGTSAFSASFFCSTASFYPPTSPPLPAQTVAALSKGILVVGDYQNGNLYLLDLDQPTDAGTQRKWLRTWRAVQKATTKPMRFPALIITMETGDQVPDGTNPQLMLRWSDDDGHTWSNQVIEAAGPTGATTQQVKYRRTGATRVLTGLDRILELSSADPFKVAIIGADWEVVA